MFQPRRIGDRIFFQSSHPSVGYELFAIAVDGDGDGIIEYFDTLNFEQDCLCPTAVAPCPPAITSAGRYLEASSLASLTNELSVGSPTSATSTAPYTAISAAHNNCPNIVAYREICSLIVSIT